MFAVVQLVEGCLVTAWVFREGLNFLGWKHICFVVVGKRNMCALKMSHGVGVKVLILSTKNRRFFFDNLKTWRCWVFGGWGNCEEAEFEHGVFVIGPMFLVVLAEGF